MLVAREAPSYVARTASVELIKELLYIYYSHPHKMLEDRKGDGVNVIERECVCLCVLCVCVCVGIYIMLHIYVYIYILCVYCRVVCRECGRILMYI